MQPRVRRIKDLHVAAVVPVLHRAPALEVGGQVGLALLEVPGHVARARRGVAGAQRLGEGRGAQHQDRAHARHEAEQQRLREADGKERRELQRQVLHPLPIARRDCACGPSASADRDLHAREFPRRRILEQRH